MASLSTKFDSHLGFAVRAGLIANQNCPTLKKLLQSRYCAPICNYSVLAKIQTFQFDQAQLFPHCRAAPNGPGVQGGAENVHLKSAHGKSALSYAQRRRERGEGGQQRRPKNPRATDCRRGQPNYGLSFFLSSGIKSVP